MRLFEDRFKKYIGSKYAVAVNSGTAALHVSTSSINIKPGDEVITTPLTFVASANCVIYRGGTPIFADIKRDTYNIDPKEGGFYYDMKYLGFRYNLSELHSAMGIHQLEKLESFQRRRREIVKIYNRELQDIEEITIPYVQDNIKHSWHLYVIQLDLEKLKVYRDYIFKALREENIGVNVHYISVHYHSYYVQNYGLKKGILPNVE